MRIFMYEPRFFAAVSNDIGNVLQSSSGGIFLELSIKVISLGGVIYGAVWDSPVSVRHKRICDLEELWLLQKSKYIKSDVSDTYGLAKKDLEDGRKVIYSGTPCQIAGLKYYLGDQNENLTTVEVICHGMPIKKAWDKYVAEIERNHESRILTINFRDKRFGWKDNSICEIFENGEEDICLSAEHPHHATYISGINMELGCGNCNFAQIPRVADITLGDFWQYKGILSEQNEKNGISLVVLNTMKGEKLFSAVQPMISCEEVSMELASQSCRHLEHTPFVHRNNRAFKALIDITDFSIAADICMKFGDIVEISELHITDSQDADEAIQVFFEDTFEILYVVNDEGVVKGIATFGEFCRNYPQRIEWINKAFCYINVEDKGCICEIKKIFDSNRKINRIPLVDSKGKLIAEVRRNKGESGVDDPRKFILPFLRIEREGKKCFYFKRPSHKENFAYTKEQEMRIQQKLSFPEMIRNDDTEILKKVMGNKYSSEYVEKLQKISPIIRIGRRYQHQDCNTEYVNVVFGQRRVCYQPETYQRSIHIYGRCGVFGYAVEDADALPSQLQKLVADMGIRVVGHSTWGADDRNIMQNLCEDLRERVIKEDDLILFYMNELPLMDAVMATGLSFFDTTEEYHKWLKDERLDVDFYDIPGHMNAEGYSHIAKYIYETIKEELKESSNPLNETMLKWGVGQKNTVFCENEIMAYLTDIEQRLPDRVISGVGITGAIVMNCNPFTKGHRYLIEKASEMVDNLLIFVVEEDRSEFSFQDRFEMVQLGVEDLENINVLPSGKYILSSLTFPEYFTKDQKQEAVVNPAEDLRIFCEYIAPRLNIKKRFAGTEPEDTVTKQYNQAMKEILKEYGIEFVEIPRLMMNANMGPVSAGKVRKYMEDGKMQMLEELLPDSSLAFLSIKK